MTEPAQSLPETQKPSPTNGEEPLAFSRFLLMLEDGVLHSDLSDAIRDLNAEMNNHVGNTGQKAKGKLTIDIDFTLDKGVFEITSGYKVKMPKELRARSIAWSTPGNNFTPFNPKQMTLFDAPRDVTSSSRRDIRSAD